MWINEINKQTNKGVAHLLILICTNLENSLCEGPHTILECAYSQFYYAVELFINILRPIYN